MSRVHSRSLALLVFLTALVALSPTSKAAEPQQMIATFIQAAPRMVRVDVQREGSRLGVGTGFPISDRVVVSVCHVVRGAKAVTVSAGSAWASEVTHVAEDVGHDLCLLRTKDPMAVRPFALKEATLGESVVAVGYSMGMGLRFHPGEVTALHEFEGAKVIRSTTAFRQGASGGALLNDKGEVVGVVSFMDSLGVGYYSLPSRWIHDTNKQEKFKPIGEHDSKVLAFWERRQEEQPEFLRGDQ